MFQRSLPLKVVVWASKQLCSFRPLWVFLSMGLGKRARDAPNKKEKLPLFLILVKQKEKPFSNCLFWPKLFLCRFFMALWIAGELWAKTVLDFNRTSRHVDRIKLQSSQFFNFEKVFAFVLFQESNFTETKKCWDYQKKQSFWSLRFFSFSDFFQENKKFWLFFSGIEVSGISTRLLDSALGIKPVLDNTTLTHKSYRVLLGYH